jgi:hypothetical protein
LPPVAPLISHGIDQRRKSRAGIQHIHDRIAVFGRRPTWASDRDFEDAGGFVQR